METQNVSFKQFSNVWYWFVDNKLSIYYGQDETKCFLLSRDKNLLELNITYDNNRQ